MVPTTTKWVGTSAGPITGANIYTGEAYDANMEIPGWADPTFKAKVRTAVQNLFQSPLFARRLSLAPWLLSSVP